MSKENFATTYVGTTSSDPNMMPEILDNVLTELNMTAEFRTDGIEFTGEIELNIDDQPDHPHASLVGGS